MTVATSVLVRNAEEARTATALVRSAVHACGSSTSSSLRLSRRGHGPRPAAGHVCTGPDAADELPFRLDLLSACAPSVATGDVVSSAACHALLGHSRHDSVRC